MTAIFGTTPGSIADLEVVAQLGRGAETVVYRVRRRGEDYALKVLAAADSGRALTAIRREAALLGCVGHPLLPRIFEVGRSDAGAYLVLEYIDGAPLTQVLRRDPLDEDDVVRLAVDLVGPLSAAHRAGLVHRDVKPDNVIVDRSGQGRLIDFGLAGRYGASDDGVAGTLAYSAPEQTGMLKRPVDGRSDLYALGVLLYECVTGQVPYVSDDVGELIRLHATAPVPDARERRPGLSTGLAAIIATLMAKDPDDRYQSGDGLLTDLRRLAERPGEPFEPGTDRRGVRPLGPTLLVGRDQEVIALANRWLRARDGAGGAAVVEGPAGAGKTRLVRELTNAVASDGDLVLYGKCVPDDPVPLAPLRGAVERYLRTVERLPDRERELAVGRLHRAAGRGGPLLRTLSPLLADLMQAPRIGELSRQEQFVNAVAAFLVGLADEFQGAVLHIDDVQWLDGPTRRVLQQVTNRLTGTPLLVIATSRDDPDSAPALDRFGADMDATLDTRLPLRPLDADAVLQLVDEHLGAVQLPRDQVAELAERAGGNPFIVGEYVRAVFDAGLVTPTWGGWTLDLAGLDRLELSGDAVDLVLQRIDGLGEESHRLLVAGATAGRWFPTELVAAVCGIDPRHAGALLAEAESRRLVTAAGTGGYRFLHDRIREALLVGLDDAATRRLHQRIAEMLDAATFDDPRYVYLTARHYALGEPHRRPDRVHLSGLNAGRLALAEHAPAEARTFLETAGKAAEAAGLTPLPGFFVALGTSCARSGRFAEALRHFDHALRDEPDKLRRAEIRALAAQVHNASWNPDRAFDAVRRGLSELGKPLPRGKFGLIATTLASVLLGLVVGRTHLGFGSARDRARERYRLQAILYDLGTFALSMRMRRLMRAMMSLRALYPINRLGPGREYAQHMAGLGVIADVAGRPALATRLYDRSAAVAAEIGDPELVGYVEWKRGAGSHLGGRDDDSQVWGRALIEHERWLDLGDYLTAVGGVCMQYFQRGRTADAEAWLQRAKARIGPGAEAEGAAIRAVEAAIAAQRGRHDEAAAHIEALRRFLRANPDNPMQLINLYGARMIALVENDQLGEPFERLAAEFAGLGIKPGSIVPQQRVIYIFEALGRLTRCRRAAPGAPAELRAAAEAAITRLGDKATSKPLRAFHRVARADFEVLDGRPEEAVRTLAGVEIDLLPMDAPLIAYEAARVHARALQALGQPGPAALQAATARTIAADQQWPQRVRWLDEEFPEIRPEPPSPAPQVTTGGRHAAEGGAAALYRRRLEALQQVSLASATLLDPRELARVALDETLRFLGAERAFLFLLDRDLNQLVPHVGRDGASHDIRQMTGYSATLVDRVRESGEPLVVTGTEEGVALGSHSMQAHGLRSILIAPLKFDGQLRGVVYLDSRVAKGVFTGDDVAILKAITNHIAVSLETARAAQLEVAVQTASRQRDVAETLRAAMADQSSSLDPDEVMRRLLGSLTRTVGGNSAVLLTRTEGDGLVVAASHGDGAAVGRRFSVPSDLLGLTGPRTRTAAHGTESVDALLGAPRSWWAIPVAVRGESFGILLVGSARAEAISEAQAQIAAAIAGQGMTAYENARLFSQVRRLATVDGLTGLYNRNHFFSEAERELREARARRTPIAAVMVDIDHFKSINDTYGHPVGDEVIRVVAARLRQALGEGDVLGRYGGEEFALVVPQDKAAATEVAERLHRVVSGEAVPTAAGRLPVTISVGLACGDSDAEPDLRQLLSRADRALYEAKQTGRDRVRIAP
ncbi:diguanylate cyclase [Paractinoplanes lichenicola]|uniref:Diguanylate cyclase n=1 Tax=Paractinoplanes lichenicola TaxID=2802976 RepID=A0ABS1VYD8_9ACTN|nr:diguanylate cyclase [Actinoplanes lichenicola]MBL7259507.1 diguanylate cyclase [Actinoplanes lichenicola]